MTKQPGNLAYKVTHLLFLQRIHLAVLCFIRDPTNKYSIHPHGYPFNQPYIASHGTPHKYSPAPHRHPSNQRFVAARAPPHKYNLVPYGKPLNRQFFLHMGSNPQVLPCSPRATKQPVILCVTWEHPHQIPSLPTGIRSISNSLLHRGPPNQYSLEPPGLRTTRVTGESAG